MYLFSDAIFYGFLEAAYGELSASIKCPKTPSHSTIYFHHSSYFEHLGVWLNMDQGHQMNN